MDMSTVVIGTGFSKRGEKCPFANYIENSLHGKIEKLLMWISCCTNRRMQISSFPMFPL